MKTIALILDRFDPNRGGLESYACFLLKRFLKKQGEALLLTGPSPVNVPPGVECISIPGKGPDFYKGASKQLLHLRESHLVLSMRHPGEGTDVFLPLGGLFYDALEARRKVESAWKRLPSRLVRFASTRTRFFLGEERKFFQKGEGLVLCSSPLVANRIQKRFPLFRGRIEVTGLPVNPHQFRIPEPGEAESLRASLHLPPKPALLLLWVGNDPKRKGLKQAFTVLSRLRKRKLEAYLLCLGHHLPPRFTKSPYCIPRWSPDPSLFYRASDLLILPTLEDNYSLSVLEALACGLPVVTTLANGAHVHLENPVIGRVVSDPLDIEGLDAAVLSLLQPNQQAPILRRREVVSSFEDPHFARIWKVLNSKT